jgi:hypothetical protein
MTAQSDKAWLTRKEAAAYLGQIGFPISPQTLAKLACAGSSRKGPAFNRLGWRTVRYHRDDLDEWARKNTERVA